MNILKKLFSLFSQPEKPQKPNRKTRVYTGAGVPRRICDICDTEYQPLISGSHYCSRKCKGEANRAGIFVRPPRAGSLRSQLQGSEPPAPPPVPHKLRRKRCHCCNELFQPKKRTAMYCSKKCQNRSRYLIKKEEMR